MDPARWVSQQGAMRLVDGVADVGEHHAVVTATVRPDNPFLRPDGTLDELATVELLAQGAAVLDGCRDTLGGGLGGQGIVVGATDLRFAERARCGETLTIDVRGVSLSRAFRVVRGDVTVGDRHLASGALRFCVAAEALRPRADASPRVAPDLPAMGRPSIFPLLGGAPGATEPWGHATEDADGFAGTYLLGGGFAAFHGHLP